MASSGLHSIGPQEGLTLLFYDSEKKTSGCHNGLFCEFFFQVNVFLTRKN